MGNKLAKDETLQSILGALQTHNTAFNMWAGALSSLTTGDKSSLVAAINELVTKRGNLSALSTSAKDTIVAAINEIYAHTEGLLQGGVPYGKELTESWASLNARIRAGDFTGIHIGDYKTITLTTGETVIMETAGIDTYYMCGPSPIGHHVDFISRDCLTDFHSMNETDNNNGTEAEKSPWVASELYQTLNDETSGIYAKLPSDLKPYIIPKMAISEERYSSGGSVNADTSWDYENMGKLWLPTEIEVFGHASWSETGFGTCGSGCNLQYPIFKGGGEHIIKRKGNGGPRANWWEASAKRGVTSSFCIAGEYGIAAYANASHTKICTPLCFRIG